MKKYQIKLETSEGISYPSDLRGLSYEDAVNQIALLGTAGNFDSFAVDNMSEDSVCRNYADGSFELFTIEDEDE